MLETRIRWHLRWTVDIGTIFLDFTPSSAWEFSNRIRLNADIRTSIHLFSKARPVPPAGFVDQGCESVFFMSDAPGSVRGSMHHEHRQVGLPKHMLRDATQNQLAQPAVAIAAHHEKIGGDLTRRGEQCIRGSKRTRL